MSLANSQDIRLTCKTQIYFNLYWQTFENQKLKNITIYNSSKKKGRKERGKEGRKEGRKEKEGRKRGRNAEVYSDKTHGCSILKTTTYLWIKEQLNK
jgi:predicted transposase YdaD